ncbi:MAG TPA: hypothetical protein VGH27_34390 [Streptosporangiaceae bacterium]|jgi:hypothetical protein
MNDPTAHPVADDSDADADGPGGYLDEDDPPEEMTGAYEPL